MSAAQQFEPLTPLSCRPRLPQSALHSPSSRQALSQLPMQQHLPPPTPVPLLQRRQQPMLLCLAKPSLPKHTPVLLLSFWPPTRLKLLQPVLPQPLPRAVRCPPRLLWSLSTPLPLQTQPPAQLWDQHLSVSPTDNMHCVGCAVNVMLVVCCKYLQLVPCSRILSNWLTVLMFKRYADPNQHQAHDHCHAQA